MKKQTRVLAFLLCFVMLFSFAGCGKGKETTSEPEDTGVLIDGFEDETVSTNQNADDGENVTQSGSSSNGNNGGSNNGGSNNGGSSSNADPFANIPSRLRGTTVVFAHFGDEGAAEYEKVLKAFTKKTGIKNKLVSYNQGEYVAQVAKQIAAKSGPDVIICNATFPSALEIAQPLQNYINLNDNFWDDEITEISTIGGNTYFVNSLEGVWENIDAVFYNKSLFANNGITSPLDYYNNGKWTYENLKKCAEEIKKLGYVGGYADANKINTGLGTPMIGYDAKTATFKAATSSQLSVGYQFRAQLFSEGLWSTSDWWGTFGNGNIGLYVSGFYGAKYNGFFKDMDDNAIGMVPMPTSIGGKSTKPTASFRAYGIAKNAKNPEGAAYLLRYYLDYEYYSGAGANVFKNKNLEKMAFTIMADVKKTGRNFDFSDEAMILAGSSSSNDALNAIGQADPAQVPSMLAAQQNVFDNAAKKANEKIAGYK